MTLPIGSFDPGNLPEGVYTPGDLSSVLQDHSKEKFQQLAAGRFPSIVSTTSAGDPGVPANPLNPLGWVVELFAKFTENVANADPADIKGPDDLLPLITDFFEDLPVIGVFVDLWDAMTGEYVGDDPILQFIQNLFAPLRRLLELVTGQTTLEDFSGSLVTGFFDDLHTLLSGGDVSSSDGFFDGLSSLEDAIGDIAAGFADLWSAINGTYTGSDSDLTGIAGWAADRVDDIGGIVSGLFNGWFGSGSTGDVAEVQTTIEAVKDAVINGYTVQTFTSSGTWTKPAGITELVVIAVGGGRNGAGGGGGTTAPAAGGAGGLSGGYIAQNIDPSTVASTVAVTVAAAGANNSSFGTHVVSTPGTGGIATQFGYSPTASLPGSGGAGGNSAGESSGTTTPGSPGETSALASAGTGGSSGSGGGTSGAGTSGGSVSAGVTTKCGGGGGGGGGGRGYVNTIGATVNGGAGGAGGYPGGGGGGGGACSRGGLQFGSPGAGGAGAAGVVWIFYR